MNRRDFIAASVAGVATLALPQLAANEPKRSWQMPTTRKETIEWNEYWVKTDATIAAAFAFYEGPMSDKTKIRIARLRRTSRVGTYLEKRL
jgi:hypothetical protein